MTRSATFFAFSLTLMAAALAGTAANAQSLPDGWTATAGAGAIYAPAYQGSDDYQLSLVPDVSVKYREDFEASVHKGVRYNLVNYNGLRAGPIARYDFGRDEDGDSMFRVGGDETNDLRGLGDVDGAPELGGFIEYDLLPFLEAKAELRQAIGGHEGLVGDLGVNYKTQIGGFDRPVYFSAGPRMRVASEDYTESYFGIDAGQSARSGLAAYTPEGGVVSYGVGSSLTVPVTEKVRTTVFAGYDRLGDEAADSPLVEQRGSANQGMAGITIGYSFN